GRHRRPRDRAAVRADLLPHHEPLAGRHDHARVARAHARGGRVEGGGDRRRHGRHLRRRAGPAAARDPLRQAAVLGGDDAVGAAVDRLVPAGAAGLPAAVRPRDPRLRDPRAGGLPARAPAAARHRARDLGGQPGQLRGARERAAARGGDGVVSSALRTRRVVMGLLAVVVGGSGIVVGQLRDDPPAPAAPESRVAAASADLRFLRREAPPGTTVVDVAGTVLATLTDGARTATLDGPPRTFAEPQFGGAPVTTRVWVRLLPHEWRPGAENEPW